MITLFNDKVKKRNPKIDRSSMSNDLPLDYSMSIGIGVGKAKQDWLSYAQSRMDPMPIPKITKEYLDLSLSASLSLIP